MTSTANNDIKWTPDGCKDVSDARRNLSIAEDKIHYAHDQEDDPGYAYAAKKTASEALSELQVKYPEATLWLRAENQALSASTSDPTKRYGAAQKCQEIIRNGGGLEDAESALKERKEMDRGI